MTELVAAIGETTGERPVVRHVAADVDGDLVADTERMRDELGVTPQVGLAEGLRASPRTSRVAPPERLVAHIGSMASPSSSLR